MQCDGAKRIVTNSNDGSTWRNSINSLAIETKIAQSAMRDVCYYESIEITFTLANFETRRCRFLPHLQNEQLISRKAQPDFHANENIIWRFRFYAKLNSSKKEKKKYHILAASK